MYSEDAEDACYLGNVLEVVLLIMVSTWQLEPRQPNACFLVPKVPVAITTFGRHWLPACHPLSRWLTASSKCGCREHGQWLLPSVQWLLRCPVGLAFMKLVVVHVCIPTFATAQVAECKFLNNQLVEVVAFMENISLKDGTEKDLFFKRLPAMIPAIPEPVAIRKILPLLSNALEYGGAPATAVSSLLLIGR